MTTQSILATAALSAGRYILDVALPPRCIICGTQDVDSVNFCLSCWGALTLLSDDHCHGCGLMLEHELDAPPVHGLCEPCAARPPPYSRINAATLYEDNSAAVVLKLKYGKKTGVAKQMARLMQRHLPPDAADWTMVPVPLHRWRLWQRGFNQAALLAQHLARDSGATMVPDALVRVKRTRSLGHMDGDARRRELANAVRPHAGRMERISARRIILIDDVVTTGATSNACVRALLDMGAKEVRILSWARVIRNFS